jgi:hypothetical protein
MLKTTANTIESELLNQAQSLLDQLPMDMGDVQQDIEKELREHGDNVRQGIKQQGIESAHNEKHLQQMGQALMAEMQQQAAGHKSDMHIMSKSNRGTSEHTALPTQAQCTERMRLHNEITTEIKNYLGMNPTPMQNGQK